MNEKDREKIFLRSILSDLHLKLKDSITIGVIGSSNNIEEESAKIIFKNIYSLSTIKFISDANKPDFLDFFHTINWINITDVIQKHEIESEIILHEYLLGGIIKDVILNWSSGFVFFDISELKYFSILTGIYAKNWQDTRKATIPILCLAKNTRSLIKDLLLEKQTSKQLTFFYKNESTEFINFIKRFVK